VNQKYLQTKIENLQIIIVTEGYIMKNSMKRMLSAVMAITMVASATSATAFADVSDASADKTSVSDLNGTAFSAGNNGVEMPAIKVSVPTTNVISIDPYNTLNKGQISSNDNIIINYSNVPMSVKLTSVKAEGTGVTIEAKAKTDDSKWAVVSLAVTDGANKETTKVLSGTEQEIAVSTAMAPYGGVVKFNVTGTCALDPATAWGSTDKVNVSATYKFTPNTYATYEVTKAPTTTAAWFWDKTQATEITLTGDEATVAELNLPKTISNGGKELPVIWKYTNGDGDVVVFDDTALGGVSSETVLTACVPTAGDINSGLGDEEAAVTMYTVATGVTLPSITIKPAPTT
jgi:hypothetical protein